MGKKRKKTQYTPTGTTNWHWTLTVERRTVWEQTHDANKKKPLVCPFLV